MADINNLPEPSITIAERMLKRLGDDFQERYRHDYRITIQIQKNDFNHEEDKLLRFTFRNKSYDETEPLLTRKDFLDYLSSKGFKPLEAVIDHFRSGQQLTLIIIDMVKMRPDSIHSFFEDLENTPDYRELSAEPMARLLDSGYSIDNLIEFMGLNRIKYDFFEFAEEVKSWMSELKPQAEVVPNAGAGNDDTEPKDKELTAWLRATWINEGKLGGTAFFNKLKKYANQKGSPITEHYSAGKVAGIKWETSAGTTGEMKKKTIQTKVSTFKNTS